MPEVQTILKDNKKILIQNLPEDKKIKIKELDKKLGPNWAFLILEQISGSKILEEYKYEAAKYFK